VGGGAGQQDLILSLLEQRKAPVIIILDELLCRKTYGEKGRYLPEPFLLGLIKS
jgi:hypothetical protein